MILFVVVVTAFVVAGQLAQVLFNVCDVCFHSPLADQSLLFLTKAASRFRNNAQLTALIIEGLGDGGTYLCS
jgi:hypothetical protein